MITPVTDEIMYMTVIAGTSEDDDFTHIHLYRAYFDEHYKLDVGFVKFMVDEDINEEVPKDEWEGIFKMLYKLPNWSCSAFEKVIVSKCVEDDVVKYYNHYGTLIHKEKADDSKSFNNKNQS